MNVNDLFEQLSYSELSNLNIGVEGTGAIVEEKQPAIVLFANEALLRLHTRFVLKEKDLLIELVSHITNYHLIERYAESRAPQPGVPYPYIKDLAGEQFIDDIIKITNVYDTSGYSLLLNDADHIDSVFTPRDKLLQVPYPITGSMLNVLYQAKHPILTMDNLEAEIVIPDVLVSAMRAHIAAAVYSGIATPEAMAKSAELSMKYETLCAEVTERDAVNSSLSNTNTRFAKRGWV